MTLAQCNWVYAADNGTRYNVGLFHSTDKGHVLIHCNGEVMLIDFEIFGTKSYSFFLEEELCTIQLHRKGDRMHYAFEIDKRTDTPRNRLRKKIDAKTSRQTWLFFGTLVTVALLFGIHMAGYKERQANLDYGRQIDLYGTDVYARVSNTVPAGDSVRLSVAFLDGITPREHHAVRSQDQLLALSHGIPIEPGFEFRVRYLGTNPANVRFFFEEPSPGQQERFMEATLARHLAAQPQLTRGRAACQVEAAYQIRGLAGLADLYFQGAPPSENPYHNTQTYQRLVRDLPFLQLDRACALR